jgi:hypothetical protein
MNAAKIREGFEYAVNDTPRKGISEERLHTLYASRVRVIEKGVERWAPSAKDSWGDPDGNYKRDGIRVVLIDRQTGAEMNTTQLLKSRDFLMPWPEYQQRNYEDEAAAKAKADAREALRVVTQAKVQDSLTKLRDIEGLVHGGVNADWWLTGPEDNHDGFRFSVDGMAKVLDHISIQVYKILSEQE